MGYSDESGERRPRVRVAAICVRDDALLLVRHVKDGKTYWLLPGGGVDYGETLVEALRREVMEETNLDIAPRDAVIITDSIRPDGGRHILNVCFTADVQGGALERGDDERLAEVRFLPVAEIGDLALYPDLRDVLIRGIREGFPGKAEYKTHEWLEES